MSARAANDQELKQGIKLVFDATKLGVDLVQRRWAQDLLDLLQVGNDAPAVVGAGALLWPEYKSLDDAARADLHAYVATLGSLPAPVETVTEVILDTLIQLSKLFTVLGKASA